MCYSCVICALFAATKKEVTKLPEAVMAPIQKRDCGLQQNYEAAFVTFFTKLVQMYVLTTL